MFVSRQIKWEGSKTYNKSFKDSNEKTFPANPLHGTVTGLTPGTVYKFRISAKTSCGEGTFSTATASTLTDGKHFFFFYIYANKPPYIEGVQ